MYRTSWFTGTFEPTTQSSRLMSNPTRDITCDEPKKDQENSVSPAARATLSNKLQNPVVI
jgi:hypothetical protein